MKNREKVVSVTVNSGIGFFGMLFLVLLVLKVLGKTTIGWWAVTLPLWWWIPLIVVSALVFMFFLYAQSAYIKVNKWFNKTKKVT